MALLASSYQLVRGDATEATWIVVEVTIGRDYDLA
jgi:hypothetical protein